MSTRGGNNMKREELAKVIDHTILKPEATREQVVKLCNEAIENRFASVCVNPVNVEICAQLLKETDVKVCTVIGFPLGANTTKLKAFETEEAINDGAQEVDMVINVGKLKDEDFQYVENDIRAVVEKAKGKAITKVILETCLLTKEEIEKVCQLSVKAGADFVKTSTGFSLSGAKIEDIKLMRKCVCDKLGVKASGGIRSYEDCIAMIEAGATRIGASASVSICEKAE
jgi:deoxyribose-phosphate aldolase